MTETAHIIYTDAAANTVTRTVNRFGKQITSTHGWRIGVVVDGDELQFFNTKCTDSWGAETFALLKAVEVAAERFPGQKVVIRFDGGSPEKTRHEQANKYVHVMNRIAAGAGLDVTFEPIPGTDNLADAVSRRETEEKRDEPSAPARSAEDVDASRQKNDEAAKAIIAACKGNPALDDAFAKLKLKGSDDSKKVADALERVEKLLCDVALPEGVNLLSAARDAQGRHMMARRQR